MAHKERESEVGDRPAERRHRSKSEKERDPNRPHKSSKSSRPKPIDPETKEGVKSPHRRKEDKERDKGSSRASEPSSSMADLVPELARTASAPGASSRSSLPYPSFNKAHSKEALNSKDDIKLRPRTTSPYTPDSTAIGTDYKARSMSAEHFTTRPAHMHRDGRPPSPPDTEFSQQRKGAPSRMSKVQEEEESRPTSRTSSFGRSSSKKEKDKGDRSRSSSFGRSSSKKEKDKDDRSKVSSKSKGSRASTAIKSPRKAEHSSEETRIRDSGIGSGVDSNVTSVAPKRDQEIPDRRPPPLDTYSSPESAQDSSPRTPTQTPQYAPPASELRPKPTPSPFIHFDENESVSNAYDSPQPPPPPPPPNVPINVPRVDYLMQNGGLVRPAPKTLLPSNPLYTSQQNTTGAMPTEIEKIFGPYFNVLDQYETVINKNGSLAVATGYRSVARRLLDRLENVFNRDLSSEGCTCVMCQNPDFAIHEGKRGLGWGEVLEWVSGRNELPLWPAFDFAMLGVRAGEDLAGLGISNSNPARPGSPVKIDPDVAEEFREHYLQQSKKTKVAVDRWLSSCPQTAATPPQEVDDETLSFAILTHLDQHDRPIFNALISGSTVVQPMTRAPTPMRKPRSDFMAKTVHSIQRLYRLSTPPRDPEAAIYLLKNPQLHNLLATISSINPSEWEILISGRFDGFLWSGADGESSNPPSRGPTPANGMPYRGPMSPAMRQATANASRTNTPFSPMRNQTFSPSLSSSGFLSRGPTPFAPPRQPVSNDEETEIAVLAEIEREIYLGMEALEDAFEGLHRKAELVRRALRERGAGLSMSLQSRRTSHPDIIQSSTPGPPSAGLGLGYERPNWGEGSDMVSESDWDPGDDMMSELAPDDSASNISTSRHRRPKRRNERRTPALVEEEDED